MYFESTIFSIYCKQWKPKHVRAAQGGGISKFLLFHMFGHFLMVAESDDFVGLPHKAIKIRSSFASRLPFLEIAAQCLYILN